MNLVGLQKQLDDKKWFESEKDERNLTGRMSYCVDCKYRNQQSVTEDDGCILNQEERKEAKSCAKAYLELSGIKLKGE